MENQYFSYTVPHTKLFFKYINLHEFNYGRQWEYLLLEVFSAICFFCVFSESVLGFLSKISCAMILIWDLFMPVTDDLLKKNLSHSYSHVG